MAANDPIHVTPQNRQEQAAIDALRPYLRPWRCTFVDQRDDFGRDGVVQIVDADNRGTHFISPLTFWLQCKSEAKALPQVYADPVETRHMALWANQFASPLILALWSVADGKFRFRSARDVVEELERTSPNWRNQDYVNVNYRSHHGYTTPAEALDQLSRTVKHELDQHGGVEAIHSTRRRIVLTTLFPSGRVSTSETLGLSGSHDAKLILGEGWIEGDIDSYEVLALHVLAASLLLYEEVWVPFNSLRTCLDLLGDRLTLDLLDRGRLRPYSVNRGLGFHYFEGATTGRLVTFEHVSENSIAHRLKNGLRPEQVVHVKSLAKAVTIPAGPDADSIRTETLIDLRKPNIRAILGLRPHLGNTDEEPFWDAQLVNRMASMNLSSAVAAAVRADAIQLEAGMSRLSSEKYYHSLGLDRRFASTTMFDSVLRTTGAPDLGQLTQKISLQELCSLSDTIRAQDFRDWFWSSAAGLLGTGSSLTQTFLKQVETLVNQDIRAFRFSVDLKFRYLESFGSPYILGPIADRKPAFASTSANAEATISRQRMNWTMFRTNAIKNAGYATLPYDTCPCLSGAKFRFCCGRPVSKLWSH